MQPLDQSIVFDGAWRLLCDQWFFREFRTPLGFTPIVLQTLFFKLFGVNWTAFVLHAAVINGIFSVISYVLLRALGGTKPLSGFIALLSGLVFYTPMSTPFPDQHAFFFSFLALVAVAIGALQTGGISYLLLFLGVPLFVFGLLSKQAPTLFILPGLVILYGLSVLDKPSVKTLGAMVLGVFASGLVVCWFFPPSVLFGETFWNTMVEIPSELGRFRFSENKLTGMTWLRSLYLRPFQILTHANTVESIVVLLPIVIIPASFFSKHYRQLAIKTKSFDLIMLVLILSLHLASSVFVDITSNQRENGIPFVFICIGLALIWVRQSEFIRHLLKESPTLFRNGALGLVIVTCTSMILNAYEFTIEVNEPRKVLDSEFAGSEKIAMLPGVGLDGVEYFAPYFNKNLRPDSLVLFLKENPGQFFLFGDMALLNGLVGNEPISPVLWLHEGLTLPKTETGQFVTFKTEFANSVIKAEPRYIIFENDEKVTYTHFGWNQLPELDIWLEANETKRLKVGGFDVRVLK